MNTPTEKVDVKSIIEKANAKKTEVVKSTEKVQSKIETYRIIPNFDNYEFNGNVVRNFIKKNIIMFKTGTKKYQLFNNTGKRVVLSKDDIIKLMPDFKTKNTPKENVSLLNITQDKLADFKNNVSVNDIINSNDHKHIKHYKLHLAGLTTHEIMALTNTPYNAVKRNIWYYTSGKKTLNGIK